MDGKEEGRRAEEKEEKEKLGKERIRKERRQKDQLCWTFFSQEDGFNQFLKMRFEGEGIERVGKRGKR